MLLLLLIIVVFGLMAIEARRATRNERAQRARGGVEADGDVFATMRVAYPAAFLAMCAEGAISGVPGPAALIAGAILFASGKALKWWAIATLGPFWTFRLIVVPGMTLVQSGPYRWMRHPNYVGVVGELAGAALMTGAAVTGPLATAGFIVLLLKRVAVESRMLIAAREGGPTSK